MDCWEIRLVALSVDHVTPAYVGWMNDPVVTQYMAAGWAPQTRETVRAFVEGLRWPHAAAFAIEVNMPDHFVGRHVGNVMLRQIDWLNRTAEVGILLGSPEYWGRGVATTAVERLTDYAKRLALRKLWAATYNPACSRLFARCGWTQEGCQRSQGLVNGHPADHVFWGLLIG